MTLYEQIQHAIDFIEGSLGRPLRKEEAAREACMSVRSFQTWFWAVTGHSFRDYLVGRRLGRALDLLRDTDMQVLDIALEVGYGSHEAFTRAFRDQFGISPRRFRRSGEGCRGLGRLLLYKEMYMGTIVKDLPRMLAVAFDGFAPEPERKAGEKLAAWAKAHPAPGRPRRVFGHNIDRDGRMDCNPQNVGYRFLASIEAEAEADGGLVVTMEPGRFAVTGIEGSLAADPAGGFIGEGWSRMNAMIGEKGYRVKEPSRWYEEELEPGTPGNLRLDLYLEIEG